MACPNLREITDKKGFFTGKIHYECSCTHGKLDFQYVNSVCKCSSLHNAHEYSGSYWGLSQKQMNELDNRYKTCNNYKRYGIKNGGY